MATNSEEVEDGMPRDLVLRIKPPRVSGERANFPRRHRVSINACVCVYHSAKGEGLEHTLTRQSSQRRCKPGLGQDSSHCSRQGGGIAGRDSEPSALDDFFEATNSR